MASSARVAALKFSPEKQRKYRFHLFFWLSIVTLFEFK
jgi:hypothetical protein